MLEQRRCARLRAGEKNCWLEIVLDEGKNRQIRRILEALDIEVLRLMRVSIGPLQLGTLAKGNYRCLSPDEKDMLNRAMRLKIKNLSRQRPQKGKQRTSDWNFDFGMNDFTFLAAVEMARRIREKKISPVQVADAHLAKIERLNPKLNAFVDVDVDRVRREAHLRNQR